MLTRKRSRMAQMTEQIANTRSSFVGRQPVFNSDLDVVAYELLLRDGPVDTLVVLDGGTEAPRLLLNTFLDLDLAAIAGDKPAQITVTRELIRGGIPTELGPDKLQLIVGGGVSDVEDLAEEINKLSRLGYRIILDDPTRHQQLHALRDFANAIRLNVSGASSTTLATQTGSLGASRRILMADGVESYQDLRAAKRIGFAHFQGPFLSRPDLLKRKKIPTARLTTLGLIALLQDPDASIQHLAELIRRDVSLSYRVLQVVNSAYYSLPNQIETVESAVMVMGTRQLGAWVGLMKLNEMSTKPSELTVTAMIRAQACEGIAETLGLSDAAMFYTVGLFSVLEAMLDAPAATILEGLSLADDIVAAIVDHSGVAGKVLDAVVAYENGDWDCAQVDGIEEDKLSDIFRDAIDKTTRMWRELPD